MRPARIVHGIRWYLREISGTAGYERYCLRHRREHPGAPVPTRKAYERARLRRREENPQGRCC